MFINEYCTGVFTANGEPKCLHVAMFYRSSSHHSTNSAELTHIQCNTLRPCGSPPSYESLPALPPADDSLPPPSYDSLSPPPPAYESLPPSTYDSLPPPSYDSLPPPPPAYESLPPPAYESLPPPPPYNSVPPPPPAYEPSPSSHNSSPWAPRPTLPPFSALLSSLGSAAVPSSPLPPTATTTASAPRMSLFHARYCSSDKHDSSQDRHALHVLTSESKVICLSITGTRSNRRVKKTQGSVSANTRGLRESTLLGSISAEDLDKLNGLCRQAHLDLLPTKSGRASQRKRALPNKRMPCHFLSYTLDTPPPPYNKQHARKSRPTLASSSREWAAAVIALADSNGILKRN